MGVREGVSLTLPKMQQVVDPFDWSQSFDSCKFKGKDKNVAPRGNVVKREIEAWVGSDGGLAFTASHSFRGGYEIRIKSHVILKANKQPLTRTYNLVQVQCEKIYSVHLKRSVGR